MASSPSPNRSQPKEKIYDGDGVLINWQMADTMSANNMNEPIDALETEGRGCTGNSLVLRGGSLTAAIT